MEKSRKKLPVWAKIAIAIVAAVVLFFAYAMYDLNCTNWLKGAFDERFAHSVAGGVDSEFKDMANIFHSEKLKGTKWAVCNKTCSVGETPVQILITEDGIEFLSGNKAKIFTSRQIQGSTIQTDSVICTFNYYGRNGEIDSNTFTISNDTLFFVQNNKSGGGVSQLEKIYTKVGDFKLINKAE